MTLSTERWRDSKKGFGQVWEGCWRPTVLNMGGKNGVGFALLRLRCTVLRDRKSVV